MAGDLPERAFAPTVQGDESWLRQRQAELDRSSSFTDWLRSQAPQVTPANDDTTYDAIVSRLKRTGTGLVRGALNTSANWLDWKPQVGPDTIAPLGAMTMPGLMGVVPRSAVGSAGGKLPERAFAPPGQPPRQLDDLGFYSKALEEAKALKQAKGTGEQLLAQLKNAGVKDAEIKATGLDQYLAGKSFVTRDEIVRHLGENGDYPVDKPSVI